MGSFVRLLLLGVPWNDQFQVDTKAKVVRSPQRTPCIEPNNGDYTQRRVFKMTPNHNGTERVRQPCSPKTHIEILASCINQLEGETRKSWWELGSVVHGKFCYKGFLRPSAATHGGKSLSERM